MPVEFGTYLVPGGGDFPVRDHQASVRLDHRLTQRDDLSGRFLLDDLRSPLTAGAGPLEVGFFDEALLPSGRDFVAQRTQNVGHSGRMPGLAPCTSCEAPFPESRRASAP